MNPRGRVKSQIWGGGVKVLHGSISQKSFKIFLQEPNENYAETSLYVYFRFEFVQIMTPRTGSGHNGGTKFYTFV